MDFLVILGPPGSGKGTLSRQLQEQHRFHPISTGEEIRKQMADPASKVGHVFAPYMDRGDYIPDALALELFYYIMESLPGDSRVALDGFPRTVPQAEIFFDWITKQGHRLLGCVFLEIPIEIAVQRMEARLVCPQCRRTSPTVAGSPAGASCEACGGKLMPREDDDPVRMRQRLLRHQEMTLPLHDWFLNRHHLLALDASQTTETLRQEIAQKFKL